MALMSSEDAAASFHPLRPKLIRIAYRMLGSVADAEDVVQEAFLRWLDADRESVREPEAFLRRVVTRLCIDHLKSARHRRETYIGPWLPEPVIEPPESEFDDITLPLMMALERLSPLERAAFCSTTCSASASRRLRKRLVESRRPAANSQAARAITCVQRVPASPCPRSEVSRSRLHSSPRPATATCRG